MDNKDAMLQGLIVSDPPKLTKKCQDLIRKALSNNRIGFDQLNLSGRNREVYTLRGEGTSRARAKYNYTVIPFLPIPDGTLWLGTTLEFVFKQGNYLLEQVSIIIFRGEATDAEKVPLLRAEWDAIDSSASRAKHAQPHWHVYSSPIRDIPRFMEFMPKTEVVEFESAASQIQTSMIWEEGAKFHLAMASKWHIDGDNAHWEVLDEEKLLKWLRACLLYIQEQLHYIYRAKE